MGEILLGLTSVCNTKQLVDMGANAVRVLPSGLMDHTCQYDQ